MARRRASLIPSYLPPRCVTNERRPQHGPPSWGRFDSRVADITELSIFEPFPPRYIPPATDMDVVPHFDEVFFIQPPLLPSFIKRMEHKRQRNPDEQSPHRCAFRVSLPKTNTQIQIINSGEKHQGNEEPSGTVTYLHELTIKVRLACMRDWRFSMLYYRAKSPSSFPR